MSLISRGTWPKYNFGEIQTLSLAILKCCCLVSVLNSPGVSMILYFTPSTTVSQTLMSSCLVWEVTPLDDLNSGRPMSRDPVALLPLPVFPIRTTLITLSCALSAFAVGGSSCGSSGIWLHQSKFHL